MLNNQKKINIIKMIVVLVFMINSLNSYCLMSANKIPDKRNNSLRILDINVWSGLTYKGIVKMGEYESPAIREQRYRALVTQIKQLDPDIIGIHEANKLPDYAKRLADSLGYNYFYHIGLGGIRLGKVGLPWNLREGDIILTKKYLNPEWAGRKQLLGGYVGRWASFNFSDASQVIAVKITFRNTPIFLFTTHWHASLSDSPLIINRINEMYNKGLITKAESDDIILKIKKSVKQRMIETKKTLEFINKIASNHPFILMGDCNAEPSSKEIKTLIQNKLVDVFYTVHPDTNSFTWDPRSNINIKKHYLKDNCNQNDINVYNEIEYFTRKIPKRIDYIFLGPVSCLKSGIIKLKSTRIVMKKIINGIQASDHYGVLTDIEINQ